LARSSARKKGTSHPAALARPFAIQAAGGDEASRRALAMPGLIHPIEKKSGAPWTVRLRPAGHEGTRMELAARPNERFWSRASIGSRPMPKSKEPVQREERTMTSLTLVAGSRRGTSMSSMRHHTGTASPAGGAPDGGPVIVAEDRGRGFGGASGFPLAHAPTGSEHEEQRRISPRSVEARRPSMSWRWTAASEDPGRVACRDQLRAVAGGPSSHSRIRACATRRVAASTRKGLDRSAPTN